MALYFQRYLSKTFYMPNSANRNNGGGSNSNKGQPKHHEGRDTSENPNPERSDIKHGSGDHPKNQEGDTSRSSNQGRKEASGGSADD
jgi:hypothetical protein